MVWPYWDWCVSRGWPAWQGVLRRGLVRVAGLSLAVAAFAVAILLFLDDRALEIALIVAGFIVAVACAKAAVSRRAHLPPAPAPQHPVLVFNPRSGGGKTERFALATEARKRGIEPIELGPGQDLETIVRDAVARGADALAMASQLARRSPTAAGLSWGQQRQLRERIGQQVADLLPSHLRLKREARPPARAAGFLLSRPSNVVWEAHTVVVAGHRAMAGIQCSVRWSAQLAASRASPLGAAGKRESFTCPLRKCKTQMRILLCGDVMAGAGNVPWSAAGWPFPAA